MVIVGKGDVARGLTQNGDMVSNGNDHQTNLMHHGAALPILVGPGKPAADQTKSTIGLCRTGKEYGRQW